MVDYWIRAVFDKNRSLYHDIPHNTIVYIKIRNDYYAFNEYIPIIYKPTGKAIGSEYFFEEIVNGLCDCRYNAGSKKLKTDMKREE